MVGNRGGLIACRWKLLLFSAFLLIAVPAVACDDALVFEGLRLFTQETFGGNGRTCATCHPPTHNFTIDPAYIGTLPADDPLFVAENNPKLRSLERPELLRQDGLISVNVDGFGRPAVSRSVPHLHGLSQSVKPGATPFPGAHMTGWSGDGSPGPGSLRTFAMGAVRQHFTRTIARRACGPATYNPDQCDFRMPSEAELNALQEFQLFLGRQSEINIEPYSSSPGEIVFRDWDVEYGKMLFHTVAGGENLSCASCHRNAGANDQDGNGTLFDVGANKDPRIPACLDPGKAPGDGGFGRVTQAAASGKAICGTAKDFNIVFTGDNRFNTPSVIEAADTGPFFHNNIVNTIEDAVAFYSDAAFAGSEAAKGVAFQFLPDEQQQIAAMLRTLNALDNMNNSDRFDMLALRGAASQPTLTKLVIKIAASETKDAIGVLSGSPLPIYADTNVISLLNQALAAEQQAITAWNPQLMYRAVNLRKRARAEMIRSRE